MKSIPVFYTSKLVASSHSFSPSAGKPRLVVESWKKLGIPISILDPKPLTREEICTAHTRSYVDQILNCERDNGFENRLPEVAESLPYTTAAFVEAAREAVRNGQVAVAPVAGFHHAHHDYARGFCTFNGLVIAAQLLKQEGWVKKVGILDFDQHYGDGTVDIIRQRELKGWLSQYSAGAQYYSPGQAQDFLKRIPSLVEKFADCDILLYQAGADPHIYDPLGGWLTTEQLKVRDELVFISAKALGIPVAWNLAGGYQPDIRKVLDIHDNTLRTCWDVYGEALPKDYGIDIPTDPVSNKFSANVYEVFATLISEPGIKGLASTVFDPEILRLACIEKVRRDKQIVSDVKEFSLNFIAHRHPEWADELVSFWDEGIGFGWNVFVVDETPASLYERVTFRPYRFSGTALITLTPLPIRLPGFDCELHEEYAICRFNEHASPLTKAEEKIWGDLNELQSPPSWQNC